MSQLISMNDLYRKLKEKSVSKIQSINNSNTSKKRNDSVFEHNLNVLIELCDKMSTINDTNDLPNDKSSNILKLEIIGNNCDDKIPKQTYENPRIYAKRVITKSGDFYRCIFAANCRKQYTSKHSCVDHVRSAHTGEKPFKCHYNGCRFVSAYRSNLRKHLLRIHATTWRYRCNAKKCNYKSNFNYDLNRHKSIHKQHKPYKCDRNRCKFQSAYKHSLKSHLRIHAKNNHKSYSRGKQWEGKRFGCEWTGCGFRSNWKFNVNRHRRTHTREKPFKCDWSGCEFKSIWKPNVKRHMRRHTGE